MHNSEEIRIVLFGPEEEEWIRQIAQIERDTFPDPWSEKDIAGTCALAYGLCAAALRGDVVLGYYLNYLIADESEIARIASHPSYRRCGIGQRLFDHMKETSLERDAVRILLDVRESNEPAISFYRKNGFVTDGIRKNYYGGDTPDNAVLMSCNLVE